VALTALGFASLGYLASHRMTGMAGIGETVDTMQVHKCRGLEPTSESTYLLLTDQYEGMSMYKSHITRMTALYDNSIPYGIIYITLILLYLLYNRFAFRLAYFLYGKYFKYVVEFCLSVFPRQVTRSSEISVNVSLQPKPLEG
jgi:hypothetical protein